MQQSASVAFEISLSSVCLNEKLQKMFTPSTNDFVIFFCAAYGMLGMVMFYLEVEGVIEPPCDYKSPCMRFCCNNMTLCREDNIRATFNTSLLERYGYKLVNSINFLVLLGRPTCDQLEKLPNDNYYFTSVCFDILKFFVFR